MTDSTNRPSARVTQWLLDWNNGDRDALDLLMPTVDGELHRLARSLLRSERADHTLQTTALINEAFIRLIEQRRVDWKSRAHFFGIAARLMRQVLVDHARKRGAFKRRGEQLKAPLELAVSAVPRTVFDPEDILALHEKLAELESLDPLQSSVVELRVFGGLSEREVAEVTGESIAKVRREWGMAKAWLHDALEQ